MKNHSELRSQRGWRKWIPILTLLAVAAVFVTVCSTSSVLYPYNIWVDANCFLTVGRSMLDGLVPYLDLLEQKGPLLYAIHALAALISRDSFFGVYLVEILAGWVYLIYIWKSLSLFTGRWAMLWTALAGLVTYTAEGFALGDSAEELCLPLLSYALWLGLRCITQEEDPRWWEWLLVGITSGAVLWIKYTMLGFYLGWFVVFLCRWVKNRQLIPLGKAVLTIAAGVAIITAPFVLYFGLHGAIRDWIQVYFLDNMTGYTVVEGERSLLRNLWQGMQGVYTYLPVPFWLCLLGFVALLWRDIREKKLLHFALYCGMILGGMLLTIYIGGRNYPYYALPFAVPAALGFCGIHGVLKWCAGRAKVALERGIPILTCGVILLSAAGCWKLSPNTYQMQTAKEDLPQMKFKAITDQVPNATLLNYGFLDGGFYTICGITPTCRQFCLLNNQAAQGLAEQNRYVEEGKTDFVVTFNQELDTDRYTLVATAAASNGGQPYYLYQKTDQVTGTQAQP